VRWVVAPSAFHHKHAGPAHRAFPGSKLVGAPLLVTKRKDLTFDATLDATEFPDVTLVLAGGSPKLDEYLFIHRPSRTLVVTDWFFHFPEHPQWFTRTYLKLSKAYGKPAQTMLTRSYITDRAEARATREKLLALEFDRMIVTHGEVLETGAKAAVRDALAWLG